MRRWCRKYWNSDTKTYTTPDNDTFEDCPHGVATVLDSKQVLILALGHKKARALQQCVEGPYSHVCTISAMQVHPHGIVVCDEPATVELKVGTYRYFKDIEKENLI